jgi:hypothetical protein
MRHTPEAGAVCGNSARTDLRGGQRVTSVPTATIFSNDNLRKISNRVKPNPSRNTAQPFCHARLPASAGCFPSVNYVNGQPDGEQLARIC